MDETRRKLKKKNIRKERKYVSSISYMKLLKKPIIKSREETVKKIIEDGSSISRFGDGEFNFILGNSLPFQEWNPHLSKRLREVLVSKEDNLLVGIPTYYFDDLNTYVDQAREFFEYMRIREGLRIYKLLENKNDKIYYNATISRFYIDLKDKSHAHDYIKKVRQIWKDRDIIMCEGDKTRSGVGNDLYDNARSLKRILAPSENAYSKYDDILNAIVKNAKKGDLILIALGPTATVLAYDLYKLGYQAIDLGHMDIEYEWLLKGAIWKEKVENKYVNEVGQRDVSESTDERYLKQIVCKVL